MFPWEWTKTGAFTLQTFVSVTLSSKAIATPEPRYAVIFGHDFLQTVVQFAIATIFRNYNLKTARN